MADSPALLVSSSPKRKQTSGQPASTPFGAESAQKFQIVGIGASAGGLDACTSLLKAIPANTGMAFILVQHLERIHKSLLVDLLAPHTTMVVLEATNGMLIQRDHLYVIPPGSLLTVAGAMLRLVPAPARRNARLPFDALLLSMAEEYGARASCIVLSGTGIDGSTGVLAIKASGGFVIAQDPEEADFDGMPRSSIATGAVDAVLAVADIPHLLVRHRPQASQAQSKEGRTQTADLLPEIINLLRTKTGHDFTLYKPGTLKRRMERRMGMVGIRSDDVGRYLALLGEDATEVERLAKDLLIHVTSFFRNPAAFELLSRTVVRDMVRSHPLDRPIRIWVAGCSSGEEAYSIAMVFREQIEASGRRLRLQIFASDADADAIGLAREGAYPSSIQSDVTAARLASFFVRDDQIYRVAPELRAIVMFTVQDLLTDPPFSRLDLVSCRNLLIYLGPEAQRKVAALFHFALRPGGVLMLGNAETVGEATGRFEAISKPARLYRRVGRSRPGDVDFARHAGEQLRAAANNPQIPPPSRRATLAQLCQSLTLENHAPATVLATRKHECLYTLGPVDRFLRIAPGHATSDLLAMVKANVRSQLRLAILRSIQDDTPITVSGGHTVLDGQNLAFSIEVHPIRSEDEDLLLIHFIDQPDPKSGVEGTGFDGSRVAALERELGAAQDELRDTLRGLDIFGDEQKMINENALSVNEEFQSTNEELLTSKEELQSLNEELTTLNSQLQETLEHQRTTANDLQNVLYSTDVATIFLDTNLRIRFFTPATRALFNVIDSDIGRPLADMHSIAIGAGLSADAEAVLKEHGPIEHEVETPEKVWCRRIVPYLTADAKVEGVVITFIDITERKHVKKALRVAKLEAERANTAKSQFLAAASHDLRQSLQTLALLQALLASRVAGTDAEQLVVRLDDTVGTMSGMLDSLLDINQIEAGIVQVDARDFKIDDVFGTLQAAFSYHAKAQGLDLRVVSCGLTVHSDPRLLEQMLRNLISNAMKYTPLGKVLLGCRRNGAVARLEVWDTGIGIPKGELKSVFEEHHQLDNPAHKRSRGLGLGLAIVSRLGALLAHRVGVRSRPGHGSVFSVDVPLVAHGLPSPAQVPLAVLPTRGMKPPAESLSSKSDQTAAGAAAILIVDDDSEIRELLALILSDDGYRVASMHDGDSAIAVIESGTFRPNLLLTDYNLPNGMDGLAVVKKLRDLLGPELPSIVLTGDISTDALGKIAAQHCLKLSKPVKPTELRQAIQTLLSAAPVTAIIDPQAGRPRLGPPRQPNGHIIFVVDDDKNIRDLVRLLLEESGHAVQDYPTGEAFLAAYVRGSNGCLLLDAYLPGMGGLELLQQLRSAGDPIPTIMITGNSDVSMAVQAMKAGAADFIEKPVAADEVLASIDRALEQSRDSGKVLAWQVSAAKHIASLTPRQHQIMELVLAGHPSKNIAADLGISQRTVENHRASIMKTTQTKSLPALARLALAASANPGPGLD